jgi:ABC-type Fe3+-siderophore transport system permease subunit
MAKPGVASMSMLALLSFLIGALLGMRFKVLILIPIGLAITAVVVIAIARGDGLSTMLLAEALVLCCLQIGYLGGLLTRYMLVLARAASMRRSSLQANSAR